MKTVMHFLSDGLTKYCDSIPEPYRVRIITSHHFRERIQERSNNLFGVIIDVLKIINANYPLILYYTKLDTRLPERGRLESEKYVICGDVMDKVFVLRTFYEK